MPSNPAVNALTLSTVLDLTREGLSQAQCRRHRHCVVLAGTHAWARLEALALIDALELRDVVWLGGEKPESRSIRWPANGHARTLLGQEAALLVVDCLDGLDPDGIGIASGIVSGGGLIIFLRPPWGVDVTGPWLARKLVNGEDPLHEVTNRYTTRFWRRMEAAASVDVWDESHGLIRSSRVSHDPVGQEQDILDSSARTADQAEAVRLILKVAHGRKRRPLVLTADRGRGKTAALGIAVGRVLKGKACDVLVVTPALSAIGPLLEQAALEWPAGETHSTGLQANDRRLTVMCPSELSQRLPSVHLVLVDEAAALPVHLLVRLLRKYPRIVFSTTVHGYEGTGQGFTLRFQAHLDRETPHWRQFTLNTPIRWGARDPVEAFVLQALCLKMEHSAKALPIDGGNDCQTYLLNRTQLLADDALLSQVFSLLIDAHYRTSPLDLARLLDAPRMKVWLAVNEGDVLGVLLTVGEGALDADIAKQVSLGKRRLKGHLLPQTMAAHMGYIDAATQVAWRVVRIAVRADRRREGIGSRLLDEMRNGARVAGVDYVGAAFGAVPDLLQFWTQREFRLMRIGTRRGATNGLFSAIVVNGLSQRSECWIPSARKRFAQSFVRQLAGPLSGFEVETVCQALGVISGQLSLPRLTDHEWSELHVFGQGGRPFEAVYDLLHGYTLLRISETDAYPSLDEITGQLMVRAVLQAWDWAELVAHFEVSGRGDTVALIAADVRSYIDQIRACSQL